DILAHAPVITPRGGSDKIMAQRTRFIQAAQAIRGWAERTFPTDPNLQHAFLETLLPQGLGSFTTYLGVSAAGTAVGGPVGGILAGGLFGSSAGAAQAYFDALEHDADEETAV